MPAKESEDFLRIKAMRKKFRIDYDNTPRALSAAGALQQARFLREEIDEFVEAKYVVDQYDAILDLIVFAMGTIETMGLPFREGFNAVMDANMTKQRGDKGRGTDFDLVKPKEWIGPETALQEIIDGTYNSHGSKLLPEQEVVSVKKNDEDKAPIALLPIEVLLDVAKVMSHGANKYGKDNWRREPMLPNQHRRTLSSALRHLLAYVGGEDIDPESGLPHLDHAITQLMFLKYYIDKGLGDDFR